MTAEKKKWVVNGCYYNEIREIIAKRKKDNEKLLIVLRRFKTDIKYKGE